MQTALPACACRPSACMQRACVANVVHDHIMIPGGQAKPEHSIATLALRCYAPAGTGAGGIAPGVTAVHVGWESCLTGCVTALHRDTAGLSSICEARASLDWVKRALPVRLHHTVRVCRRNSDSAGPRAPPNGCVSRAALGHGPCAVRGGQSRCALALPDQNKAKREGCSRESPNEKVRLGSVAVHECVLPGMRLWRALGRPMSPLAQGRGR
jgi:hypothetical protein